MSKWLRQRTVWQYALILWLGGMAGELLVFIVLDWLAKRPFDVSLFAGLAVGISLIGLPGPLWQEKKRREEAAAAARDIPGTRDR